MSNEIGPEKQVLDTERNELLHQLEEWLEVPMVVLGFAWLGLFIVEVIWGLNRMLEVIGTVIWIIFILDFAVRFSVAPSKLSFLKGNWLGALSLLAPGLRVLRFARALRLLRLARVTRGLQLLRIVSSMNRGMRALGASMGRRGFGYVVALTILVTVMGAAGMYAFERDVAQTLSQGPGGASGASGASSMGEGQTGLYNYSTSLWWTAMLMTTLGSDYSPITPEGRVLAFILALYAFAVFGYVTATLATFFIGRDTGSQEEIVARSQSMEELHAQVVALRAEVRALSRRIEGTTGT